MEGVTYELLLESHLTLRNHSVPCLRDRSRSRIFTTCDRPAALPSCGLSTGKHASSFADFVNKIVVTDDDTASRRILGFTKVASATWVTDEAKCQRAITWMDANYWTAPRGGPIYLMQVGTDYAGFPGDTHSAGNPMILHFNSNFNVITTGVW